MYGLSDLWKLLERGDVFLMGLFVISGSIVLIWYFRENIKEYFERKAHQKNSEERFKAGMLQKLDSHFDSLITLCKGIENKITVEHKQMQETSSKFYEKFDAAKHIMDNLLSKLEHLDRVEEVNNINNLSKIREIHDGMSKVIEKIVEMRSEIKQYEEHINSLVTDNRIVSNELENMKTKIENSNNMLYQISTKLDMIFSGRNDAKF